MKYFWRIVSVMSISDISTSNTQSTSSTPIEIRCRARHRNSIPRIRQFDFNDTSTIRLQWFYCWAPKSTPKKGVNFGGWGGTPRSSSRLEFSVTLQEKSSTFLGSGGGGILDGGKAVFCLFLGFLGVSDPEIGRFSGFYPEIGQIWPNFRPKTRKNGFFRVFSSKIDQKPTTTPSLLNRGFRPPTHSRAKPHFSAPNRLISR